jgi:hypothetical protein
LHEYENALRTGRSAKIVDVSPEILGELLSRESKSMARGSSENVIMFRFSRVGDLGAYSFANNLIYPKELAKEEGALKHMLRRIGGDF